MNNKLTASLTLGIGIEGAASAILDMEGMERIEMEPQGRIKLLARVQIPPDPTGVGEEIDSITFVIKPVAGVTAEPIRREVPFSQPDTD